MDETQQTTINDHDADLAHLYDLAGNLEIELRGEGERSHDARLKAEQVERFNDLLAGARSFAPDSVALREDVDTVDETTRCLDAAHALRMTLVPVLHNALPPAVYETR